MKITIVGLGLIGGSMALDLRNQLNVQVYGVDKNEDHSKQALELNLVHEIIQLEDAYKISDVIILAVPVDTMEELAKSVLSNIDPRSVVIDLGSTKSNICSTIKNHKNRGRFVAAHPLAGTEFSGPTAALSGLFRGKKNIICEKDESDKDALELAIAVFESVGLMSSYMPPHEHDMHMAYVSHLSHVTSFTLGLTVLDIEKDEKTIFNLAGAGFSSTVRLAKSNPVTWASIFEKNRKPLLDAIDKYAIHLKEMRDIIATDDREKMITLMEEANEIKRILQH